MNKNLLIVAILGMLLIAACQPVPEPTKPAQADKEPTQAEEPVIAEPVTAEPTQPAEIPAEEQAPATEESAIDQATIVSDLLTKVDEKIKSYSFTYNTNRYSVVGNDIRVDMNDFEKIAKEVNGIRTDIYVSSVFLDPAAGTALGYCDSARELQEGTSLRCIYYEEYKGNIELDFSRYYVKPPIRWLEEFKEKIPAEVDTQELQVKVGSGYKTSSPRLTFNEDGVITKIYIEKFSALPHMVEQTKGEQKTTYNYRDLAVNNVKPEYVAMPSK